MNTEIRAVIFDYGNVISTVENGRFLESLSRLSGLDPATLDRRIFRESTLPVDFETGRIGTDAFAEALSALCGQPIALTELEASFGAIFRPIESTRSLIRRLKGRYLLGLLSNTNPWHFETEIRCCPEFALFDTVTLSYEVGAMKPHPDIYRDALDKLALPGEACVFIDDRPEFAAAARTHGIHGLTFSDGDLLRSELAALGVVEAP
nr:HAD family phosphatase [uncultured Holophaga sp.]